jgi:hypothetical protein
MAVDQWAFILPNWTLKMQAAASFLFASINQPAAGIY